MPKPTPKPRPSIDIDWDVIEEIVARTRAEQGLPRHVEDPVVLQKVADLIREPMLEMRRRKAADEVQDRGGNRDQALRDNQCGGAGEHVVTSVLIELAAEKQRLQARIQRIQAELQQSILTAVAGGMSIAEAERQSGISRRTIRTWLRDRP
jgi:DNA-directed RNA polymerase specialized sigma24 family protein